MTEDDKALLADFLLEAREIMDKLDHDFVQLEMSPDDDKLLGNIFRGMHTLKGSSGFFAFTRLERLSHAGEALLSKLRDKSLRLTQDMVTALLRMLDAVRQIIDAIQLSDVEPTACDDALLSDLKALASGAPSQPVAATSPVESTPPSAVDVEPLPDSAVGTEAAAPVKVSIELLDTLMNLVSEMVLARNRLLACAPLITDSKFTEVVRNVDLITLELQERMMATRMSPVSQVWNKFPRLVRDLSQAANKQVELRQIGADTELDRTLLEAIRDPLIHIIRNCIDHGIEDEADRAESGKPPIGVVTLHAKHENGMVVIEVSDDGRGINLADVRNKAVTRGLMSLEKANQMTPDDLFDLIYLPGFTTRDVVTNLSGRGVGMDVVKTNIQNIGGSVELASTTAGTALKLKIPLTLAIIPALFVRCQQERFAIPQSNLLEMVRHTSGTGSGGLEYLYGTPVFRLRKKIIPLIFLSEKLQLHHCDGCDVRDVRLLNIAIVQASGIRFGLIVDEILYVNEVVVKPIAPLLRGSAIYGGATILGDGRVALILDIEGIARGAGLSGQIKAHQRQEKLEHQSASTDAAHAMLLFDLQGGHQLAIPVDDVERLEKISRTDVQTSGSEAVIPYGDGIIKLIWIADYIEGSGHFRKQDALSVIVHQVDGVPVGLVVNQIHDIVNIPNQLNRLSPPQRGLLGCAVIDNQVINVIDVQGILAAHHNKNFVVVTPLPTNMLVEEPL